jgi:hemoglobin
VQGKLYDRLGGEAFFEQLVDRFYQSVEQDAELLALYPDAHDLTGARWRLTHFLMQYFGGPRTYSDQRGHPRLRQRHSPFAIDEGMRDRWLSAMHNALSGLEIHELDRAQVWGYFESAADAMRNQPG